MSESHPRWIGLYVIALLLSSPGIPAAAAPPEFTGKVVAVSEGDTITVLHNGRAERIRLNGIECPEKRQPFGERAKEFTIRLAYGQSVRVRPTHRDKQGRTVADVSLPDGRLLPYALVKAGLAWWFSRYSLNQKLSEMEQEARDAKRGLWIDPDPIPPWEWRQRMDPASVR